jgi:hypothetical protein
MRKTLAAILLCAASAALAQGGAGTIPPPASAPRWEKFFSRDMSFSVWMPGSPKYKSEPLTAKNGRPVQYTSYTVDLGDRAYMASYSDYDAQTSVNLEGAIDGVLSAWEKPQILTRREVTLYGHDGRVVDFLSGKYHVVVRAFAAGRRLYQLGFVCEREEYAPKMAGEFMNSFELR